MSSFAADLRGFGPVGILAILVVLSGNLLFQPLSALLVLAWVAMSRTPWREIGYVRPRSWVRDILVGVLLGATLKLLMKAIVMPLLGADPINHRYHWLAGNTAALPGFALYLIVIAGFGEETVFRGYLFERLGKLLGTSAAARALTVLITSTLFGLAHFLDQGLAGVEQAAVVGLVYGSIYVCTGRIWMAMVTHAAFDLTAAWIIYRDLETTIAHLIFR